MPAVEIHFSPREGEQLAEPEPGGEGEAEERAAEAALRLLVELLGGGDQPLGFRRREEAGRPRSRSPRGVRTPLQGSAPIVRPSRSARR
jgi:hypothetical protein